MSTPNPFENQKKARKAEFIFPPNVLKQKIGSGGIDPGLIAKAQQVIEDNPIDFKPIATDLIKQLDAAIAQGKAAATFGEPEIEAIIYPAMQMKAQGAMFHFPVITDISDILVNFLETITDRDSDVWEIIDAHKKAIMVVIASNMRGPADAKGKALTSSLMDACVRYYNLRSKS